jgi:hypothetical protein
MEHVIVSTKGKIAEVRGHGIALSKETAWKKLCGAAAGGDLLTAFALHRKQEREREDSRP